MIIGLYTYLLIPLLVGLLAAYAGIKYSEFVTSRQQKAMLVLFIQEFTLLLRRASMYYRQYLEGPVSFTALFEAGDSATFIKLAEVTDNIKIIETALMLKSDFYQVLQFSDKASEAINQLINAEASEDSELAKQAARKAKQAQEIALNFFMGELLVDGKFHRYRYHNYIKNISLLIDYLGRLNTPPRLKLYLTNIIPKLRIEKETLDTFIENRRRELDLIREKLDLLREKEKSKYTNNPGLTA